MWRVPYEPGTLKAVSTNNGKKVLTQEIKTAGAPVKIVLIADRNRITADGRDCLLLQFQLRIKTGILFPMLTISFITQ
jgi:beta-galactosidase